ncbi:23S rRNA m(5)U-1939 methyltransferase [Rubritalea squalenifaciens DSM 18772]|uniref:23S rRNA m(5)U-1939 methyltransferase n=1 Tax=Rubritalea squalenifaciens DSM 18772 TaxID=1123071 RepID=A0A1M6PTZ7_9BACT|nr:class I SAM-dependent RNA methyltransferase [Rubritalea squalenifaciens]SHK11360.1 23S rRNA m(5)U-1939 methyltransferase [Rubritalea squalenifaciens DSM 18772]
MRPHKKFKAFPFEYHQELELTIESLSNLGHGIARVSLPESEDMPEDAPQNWVVFIPFALPGEKVKVRIFRNDKNCSHGDLVEILEPSPHRREPKCPLFGECGGCQYQHVDYETQLEWKTRQVAELLQHMAGIDHPVKPAIASPREWNYRSKITPHFQKPRKGKIDAIGFLRQGRRQSIIDVPQCPIAMEELNEALPEIRKSAHANAHSYKKGATLLLRATEGRVETNNRAVATEHVGDLSFHFLAGDFFQNNPFILPSFTGYVAQHASMHGAKYLVDAYCGSGLFALTLASSFEKVAGVEVSETAADWAAQNARLNDITNTTFLASSAEAIFKDIEFPAEETAVVIDPPRKGCNQEFLDQLFAFGPSRCVYVSCNPATQMRDLKEFIGAGYKLEEVQPFDLFPQTRHLECVAILSKG